MSIGLAGVMRNGAANSKFVKRKQYFHGLVRGLADSVMLTISICHVVWLNKTIKATFRKVSE